MLCCDEDMRILIESKSLFYSTWYSMLRILQCNFAGQYYGVCGVG